MTELTIKQEKLMSGILSGLSVSDAAKEAALSVSYAQSLASGTEKKYFKAELDRRKTEQSHRLLVDRPDRSKEALLRDWEAYREMCQRSGDLTNWGRSLIEIGKLMGYYVHKSEVSNKLTVADIIASVDFDEDERLEQNQ